MKIEQYKNDVSSLKLSEGFKQSLKESMAKEYEAVAVTEAPARPWMKYSKYIATAACLVLIVATIGVVSLMGDNFRIEKSADNAMQDSSLGAETYDLNIGDVTSDEDLSVSEEEEDIDEVVEEEDVVEEDVAVEDEDDTVEEEVAAEEAPAVTDSQAETEAEEAVEYKSSYAPEDYDGEYYAEDYIVGNETSPDHEALNVASTMSMLREYIPDETTSAFDNEMPVIEEEEDVTADEPVEEEDYDAYESEGISYSELSLNTLRYLDTVNFVKFTVNEAYSAEDAVAITGDYTFARDKTLYSINLTYDYLNSTELDVTMLLAYPGTVENQLLGRPVLGEGEKYLTCLTFDNGYAEMLYELSYQVHRINGLDIAYHLVGGEGIDPGSTHMGMLDIEREVITTTLNNPAQYTHKAAVKELTRYIKRNWTREEYPFTDFDDLSGTGDDDMPVITGELVEELSLELAQDEVVTSLDGIEFDPKGNGNEIGAKLITISNGSGSSSESSSLLFRGGSISFAAPQTFRGPITEITMSEGTTLEIKVNGVGIGDSMDALVDAFDIRYNVDGKLTLYITTANAEGVAYGVMIEVEENVITEIVIK